MEFKGFWLGRLAQEAREQSCSEPIKITRKSGEAFVLLNAEEFEKLYLELVNLRGMAPGLSDVVEGRTRKSTTASVDTAIERAKARILGK